MTTAMYAPIETSPIPDHLRQMDAGYRRFCEAQCRPVSHEYSAISYLLEHGRSYPYRPRPTGVRKGKDRRCYDNSTRLASRKGWTYCEGYAGTCEGFGPLHHAWCLDHEGYVVDSTWAEPAHPDIAYFGMPIDLEWGGVLRWKAELSGMLYMPYGILVAIEAMGLWTPAPPMPAWRPELRRDGLVRVPLEVAP